MKKVAGFLLPVAGLLLWIRLGPIPNEVLDQTRFASATIVDRNGVVLYEPLAKSGTRGEHLAAADLPPNVVKATIAAEDRRFYSHCGIDPLAVARAVVHDIRARSLVEGGSTISQQVAKLLLQSPDRSVVQKVRESVLALRLEHRYSKADILAMYLSLAPYGKRITGVTRASRTYFGCAPNDLTVAQAAYLAGLPHRPSLARRAAERQKYILEVMHATQTEKSERLHFATKTEPVIAQHFVEEVLRAESLLPRASGGEGGRRPDERAPHPREAASRRAALSPLRGARDLVVTTLDAELQQQVQGIIKANQERLLKHGAHAVAVAVLDNRTGEWLAWEGSGDYFGETFGGAIDGVTTPRQPGSALKPFTYAVAFEEGYTPATVLADVPSSFPTAEQGIVYAPRNYDGQYRGPLRARSALAGSENVPAVAMLSKVGTPALLRTLRGAGLSGFDKNSDYYGLGLTLGDAEVRLDQLVAAYATFARGGVTVTPHMLMEPRLQPGQTPAKAGAPLFSQRTAFWISDILSDPDAREFIFGSGGSLDFPFRVAVKTGTSQAYRDNWTVGFTRDVTVGVWVGNFDRRELRNSSGITGAAPIFHAVMLAATRRVRGTIPVGDDAPIVEPPADLELVPICGVSGLRPSTYCPSVEKEWLPKGSRVQFCSWHHDGYEDLPGEYRAWSSVAPRTSAAKRRDSAGAVAGATLHVTNPPDGATYLIDPTLRSSFQALRLRATADAVWHVDGRKVDDEWPLVPGVHTIVATDARGNRDAVKIFVK